MSTPEMHRILVLDHTKLGESDCIVTMLSSDGSQLRGIAKGVRKSGSRFGATLEPYTIADVQLYSRRALPMITDAKIVESNHTCREDLEHSAAAAVIAGALIKTSQEGQEEARVFELSEAVLKNICTLDMDKLPVLLSAYLFKLLAMHGYRPMTDRCVSCGQHVESPELFTHIGGGVLCTNCLGAFSAVTIPPHMISWVDFLLGEPFSTIVNTNEPLSPNLQRELLQFAGQWATEHIGTRLKPLDFFLSIA